MSSIKHLPAYNNLSDYNNGFMASRTIAEHKLSILDRYQRLADAWSIDVETLYPETYRTGITKATAFREYLRVPKKVPENPITVDDIMTGTPAKWKKKIAEWNAAKASVNYPTVLGEAPLREITDAATDSLQGREAFEHLLSVIDVDQAVRDVREAWKVRGNASPFDQNIDTVREQWNTAYSRLLWLDTVLPDDMKPSLFAGVTELPVLREVVNRQNREVARLFTDDDYAKHAEVLEWRNAYRHFRDVARKISARDNAVNWLVSGDLKLPLDIAKDWETVEKRSEMYATAGISTREVFKPTE